MKAYHKYHSNNKYRGKKISDREKARRIAYSQGWRMGLMDMPIGWFALMKKGGIEFGNQIDQPNQSGVTEFVTEPINRGEAVETKTLQL